MCILLGCLRLMAGIPSKCIHQIVTVLVLIFLNEWEKLITIGHQAKEFYPDSFEIDFRIAGSYRRLSRLNEADYFIQNLLKNKTVPSETLLNLFPEFKSIFDI